MKTILPTSWKFGIGVFSLFASVATVLSTAAPSQALCAVDRMDGRWENVDPNTRGITQVNYVQRCGDQILCDTDGNCTEPAKTTIQVFGACSPTDCDWGESVVRYHQGGAWRYSLYDQGFASRVVWMRLESNGQLTVVEEVDYRDSRQDRSSWYRFDKVAN